MRASSGQERRHNCQVKVNDQGGHGYSRTKKDNSSYSSKKRFKEDDLQSGFRVMRLLQPPEKDTHYNVIVGLRPFTLVVLTLLFLIAFLTITFPLATSFEPERDLLTTTRRHWDFSSRRAKHMIKMWEPRLKRANIPDQEMTYFLKSRLFIWEELTTVLRSLTSGAFGKPLKLGIINYNKKISRALENELWGLLTSVDVVPQLVPLEPANQTWTWKDFYPEWIDEEQAFEVPECPLLPMPQLETNATLDVIFAEVPCDTTLDWRRDVLRLHIQLGVALAAAKSNSSYAALSSICPPLPNLFTCKELALKSGHLWLFNLDLPKLERKLALPVGSCELAVPLRQESLQEMVKRGDRETRREAYATILHSAEAYICGAIALGHSIRRTGSKRDMVILVDSSTEPHHRKGLEEAGWLVIPIDRIRNPHAQPESYNEWNYSKLRLWQLTTYHKLIFLDSDVLVLQNIDFLFQSEELSASANSRTIFNSGVMVLEPSNCTFRLLMSLVDSIVSYNGGDQGFLNEVFTWWHRLPSRLNFLKHFYTNSQLELEDKTKLFGMEPPLLYVLHFLGYKPWLCFRDYDCSWHFPELRKFASDVAHATWWKNYDSMPPQLQKFCSLTPNQIDILSYDIATSKHSSNADPYLHWQRNITDPRFAYPS